MNKDIVKELMEMDPKDLPRMVYLGHRFISSISHPSREAVWECFECQYKWQGEDGLICPKCYAECPNYENYCK